MQHFYNFFPSDPIIQKDRMHLIVKHYPPAVYRQSEPDIQETQQILSARLSQIFAKYTVSEVHLK